MTLPQCTFVVSFHEFSSQEAGINGTCIVFCQAAITVAAVPNISFINYTQLQNSIILLINSWLRARNCARLLIIIPFDFPNK